MIVFEGTDIYFSWRTARFQLIDSLADYSALIKPGSQ